MLVHCPSCRYAKEVPDDSMGKRVKCSRCGTPFTISGHRSDEPSGPDAAKIILAVACVLLAAGLAVVLLLPKDTTDADRAARLQNRLEQTQSRLSDAETALTEKTRAATEAISDLAGTQSMLDAKTASLDKAREEIAALKSELEALKAEPAPKEAKPETTPAPAGKPPIPATLPAPPAESSAQPPVTARPAAPPVRPEPGTGESNMPASLRKFKRENPDLFRREIVQTDAGSFPMAVVDNVNQERVEAGGQRLTVTAPPSVPAQTSQDVSADQAPATPSVQAPDQIRKAIEEKAVQDTPEFPPGVTPDADETPSEPAPEAASVVETPSEQAPEAASVVEESPDGEEAAPAEQSSEEKLSEDSVAVVEEMEQVAAQGAPQAPPLDDSVRVVEDTINVRQDRTTDSEVVYKLRPGQAVRLGFFQDGWYAVFKPEADIDDEQAALGYVYGGLFN